MFLLTICLENETLKKAKKMMASEVQIPASRRVAYIAGDRYFESCNRLPRVTGRVISIYFSSLEMLKKFVLMLLDVLLTS